MGGTRIGWHPADTDQQEGVRVREFGTGPRIEIDFRFKGVRCRECLKVELTAGNWKYAGRLRAEVLNAIARNTFRYGDYFPDSPRARLFGHAASSTTLKTLFSNFIGRCEKQVERGNRSPSTLAGYRKIIAGTLGPEFGALRASDLTPGHIRAHILKLDCTAKTIRNMYSVLRIVLDEAVEDGVIETSPLDRMKLSKIIDQVAVKSDFEIDPFKPEERKAFLAACPTDEERDQYAFWLETGLRPGELIAASWPKVDWIGGTLRVDRSIVEHVEKGPKTQAGIRDVQLTPIALAALERQKARTYLAGGRIWRSPKSEKPWETDAQLRRTSYTHIMRKAGIRWRNMYQIRHTFASIHASSGCNLFWLAEQMGHETIEMLIRHYARWIPSLGTEPATGNNQRKNDGDGHVMVTQNRSAEILRFKPRR